MKRTILAPCNCDAWHTSIPQIDAAQSVAFSHGMRYTGGLFLYCPFCGKQRGTMDVDFPEPPTEEATLPVEKLKEKT